MNTKIGTSFGLAVLLAIGVIATMLALGMFEAKPASADHLSADVTVVPAKARSIGAYTIVFKNSTGANLQVGETITVTFNTSTTVPSSIASSAVKLKATALDQGDEEQFLSADAVTVSGRAITITIPDMDPDFAGDSAILADATITVTLTQAAGIQNPNKHGDYDLDIKTTQHTENMESGDYTIDAFVGNPPKAGRGTMVSVNGGGFEKNCAVCTIRINPQNDVAPTTGAVGSGIINGDGEFEGSFVPSSSTSSGYIWVQDTEGFSMVTSVRWIQSPGATPRVTTTTPGSSVKTDLVDFSADPDDEEAVAFIATVTMGGIPVEFTDPGLSSSGSTTNLDPFKFEVPTELIVDESTPPGTYKIVITDGGGTSASFNLEIVIRVLTVIPAIAAPGQNITVSGITFTAGGKIAIGGLTATAGGVTVPVNSVVISISSTGAFDFATTLPIDEDFAKTGSNAIKIKAFDGDLEGASTSSGFSRTPRTLVLSPAIASPGRPVTVTVTGMTVDNNEDGNDENAEVTISAVDADDNPIEFSGNATFPINSDGAGSGSVTIPIGTDPQTLLFTAEDNAKDLNDDAEDNRTATANLVVPSGSVSVDPSVASTGNFITVSGTAFPPNSTGTALTFAGASGFPSGGFTTDSNGDFSVLVEVPPSNGGGSLTPGTKIIKITIGQVEGSTTGFAVPDPTIVIDKPELSVEDTATITGTGFDSLVTATVLTMGNTVVMPSPAPRAGRNGDITAEILIPLFNPGVYVLVLETGNGFSATTTVTVLAAGSSPASTANNTEDVFADLIEAGNLVRVWRFSNATQDWQFFDPQPAFTTVNDLLKTGPGDILWVKVNNETTFEHQQGNTLVPGWNLIVLK